MKRTRTIYAMGVVRGRSIHYLKDRETNYARARHTVLKTVMDNKRWRQAVVCKVVFNADGTEKDLRELWRSRPMKRRGNAYLEKV